MTYQKPKISYSTIRKNTCLDQFMEEEEEVDEE